MGSQFTVPARTKKTAQDDKVDPKRTMKILEMSGGGGNGYAMPAAVIKEYCTVDHKAKKKPAN